MDMTHLLAQASDMVLSAPGPREAWIPVVLLLVIAVGFAVGNVVISTWIGPKRTGSVKEGTYESGMVPIGDARSRFNVRFYVVAVVFLVIDVEILFMYPWATIFPQITQNPPIDDPMFPTRVLGAILVFTILLLESYAYAWKKGVFKWD